jgi:hypothetical protein
MAQVITGSNYNLPLTAAPTVDSQTSQANLADLMVSQTSPEELSAAYSRVESRCVQSMSRCVSPVSSQYSNYSSQSSSPVSETFDGSPFGSTAAMVPQNFPQTPGFGSYGGGYGSQSVGSAHPVSSGAWAWSGQVYPQHVVHRSYSCRW